MRPREEPRALCYCYLNQARARSLLPQTMVRELRQGEEEVPEVLPWAVVPENSETGRPRPSRALHLTMIAI